MLAPAQQHPQQHQQHQPHQHHYQQQPGSPGGGPAYSDGGGSVLSAQQRSTSGFGAMFSSLKRGMSPRAQSPSGSSFGGSEFGGSLTPPSRSKLGLPSFSNGQRKREIIKKLEDDVTALQMQLHTRSSQLAQLQQQAMLEGGARADAQERLNMQYFKSHLLAEMLVAQLLRFGAEGNGDAVQPAVAMPVAAVSAPAAAAGPPPATVVVEEDSFE